MLVFAVVAVSGPGRIDVIDSQTRYEVARSLVEHGDSVVRDDDTWFMVFRGRHGRRYSSYRLPHSVVAAAAIMLSDATGPSSETRRQFFFSLSGAVLCGLLTLLYAAWFRPRSNGPAALAWAAAGIFCTPLWYYGTTAYDDVLGTLVVLLAVGAAACSCRYGASGAVYNDRGAITAGLLLGLAFNCKPPLILFTPVVMAALWNNNLTRQRNLLRARVVFFCAALGIIAYWLYDLWKFPPGVWAALAEERTRYVALWPGTPWAGFCSLLVSPGMGAIWYCPASLLALYGLVVSCGRNRPWSDEGRLALMAGLSSLAFLCFIASIRFFSGEPAWGPRYLTPVFGVLWLFVPAAASRWHWPKTAVLLAASCAVQVLGLSLDPLRFFTGDNATAADEFLTHPWSYFRLDRSQLLARPGQVWDVLTYSGPPAASFTPAKAPTLPLLIDADADKRFEARAYGVFSALRPWWATYRLLPPEQRPIDLAAALTWLLAIGGAGLFFLGIGVFTGPFLQRASQHCASALGNARQFARRNS